MAYLKQTLKPYLQSLSQQTDYNVNNHVIRLDNIMNKQFNGITYFGKPQQDIEMTFDTSSSVTWVYGA